MPSLSQWEIWWWQEGSEGENPGLGAPSLGSLRVEAPPGCRMGVGAVPSLGTGQPGRDFSELLASDQCASPSLPWTWAWAPAGIPDSSLFPPSQHPQPSHGGWAGGCWDTGTLTPSPLKPAPGQEAAGGRWHPPPWRELHLVGRRDTGKRTCPRVSLCSLWPEAAVTEALGALPPQPERDGRGRSV